jgi:hypothetical protein
MSHKFFQEKFFLILFCGILSQSLVGCAVQDATSTNTVGTDASPTATPAPTGAGGATSDYFEVTIVQNENYESVISKDGDGSTPCRVTASGQDILCIVDMHELDMWARTIQLNDTMPDSVCEYRGFLPYYYQVAPVGFAPTQVEYELDASDVLLSHDPDGAGPIAGVADIWYYFPSVGWRTHAAIFGSTAQSASDVRCPWDYSATDCGKNCCYGKYDKHTILNGVVTDSNGQDWGGKYGDCFDGPAIYDSSVTKSLSGIPLYTITNVDTGGYSNIFKLDHGYSNATNIRKANYFNPTDHPQSGSTPDVPSQFLAASLFYSSHTATHSGYFQYDCLDAGKEVTARIRVLIREWNTKSELLKLLAGDTTADPDVSTNETALTQTDTFPAPALAPNNDISDWKDIQAVVDAAPAGTYDYQVYGFADLTADPDGGGALVAHPIDDFLFWDVDYYVGFTCTDNDKTED